MKVKTFFIAILLLFSIPSFLLSWNISNSEQQLINSGKQYSFPSEKFSKKEIRKTWDYLKSLTHLGLEKSGLCLVNIENETINYLSLFPLNEEQNLKIQGFISALECLNQFRKIPSCDFILALENFDRPIVLKQLQIPVFAVSKEKGNHKVWLIPRFWNWDREASFQNSTTPFETKMDSACWRGAPTDGKYEFYSWDLNPRASFCLKCKNQPLIDAGFYSSGIKSFEKWFVENEISKEYKTPIEQSNYKYLISIDGKNAPSSFEWQLFTGSVVLKKQSNREEWFYPYLKEGKHFLSFDSEEELLSIIDKLQKNEPFAKELAKNSTSFAIEYLKDINLFDYLQQLLISYRNNLQD
ncbi:hypothetical protein BN1013_01490 [Candidatus Rubidus massiliensis]|nr:hypothetical protein BN1013_01490 [Candidatus Rubidus massiliensis]